MPDDYTTRCIFVVSVEKCSIDETCIVDGPSVVQCAELPPVFARYTGTLTMAELPSGLSRTTQSKPPIDSAAGQGTESSYIPSGVVHGHNISMT